MPTSPGPQAYLECYSLPGNTNSIFALDYISGALTLNGLLDRENPLYSHGFILTVKVRTMWRAAASHGVWCPHGVPASRSAPVKAPRLSHDSLGSCPGPLSGRDAGAGHLTAIINNQQLSTIKQLSTIINNKMLGLLSPFEEPGNT